MKEFDEAKEFFEKIAEYDYMEDDLDFYDENIDDDLDWDIETMDDEWLEDEFYDEFEY